MSDNEVVTLSTQKYECPKHNMVTNTMVMTGFGDELDGVYCGTCYAEFLALNIPKVKVIQ